MDPVWSSRRHSLGPRPEGSGVAQEIDSGIWTGHSPNRRLLLNAILRAGFDEPEDDLETFAGIGTLLGESYIDPRRTRRWSASSQARGGVEVQGGLCNPSGRLGTALILPDGTREVALVFNPRSSRLFAERSPVLFEGN